MTAGGPVSFPGPSPIEAWIAEGAPLPNLSDADRALLFASKWERLGPDVERLDVLCPAGTTFDAAEALRLELVARAPAGVAVDVQIAPAPLGALSAEHEAGVRLFGELRAERLAGCSCTSPDPYECSVCSPEHEQYCNGYACAGCNPPLRCACHATSKSPPADDDPFPWDEPEGGRVVRESEPASIGRWFVDVYGPDPLLFIGAAANEGRP